MVCVRGKSFCDPSPRSLAEKTSPPLEDYFSEDEKHEDDRETDDFSEEPVPQRSQLRNYLESMLDRSRGDEKEEELIS